MINWQPIETCPLDETVYLWWTPIDDNPWPETTIIGSKSSYEPDKYWDALNGEFKPLERVTHWREYVNDPPIGSNKDLALKARNANPSPSN